MGARATEGGIQINPNGGGFDTLTGMGARATTRMTGESPMRPRFDTLTGMGARATMLGCKNYKDAM